MGSLASAWMPRWQALAVLWRVCEFQPPPLRALLRQVSLRTLDEIFQECGGEVPIIRVADLSPLPLSTIAAACFDRATIWPLSFLRDFGDRNWTGLHPEDFVHNLLQLVASS
jgi:hypothetical protein